MKVKLLMLLGMTVVPLLSIGQTTSPCFYNKGLMSVVGTDPNSTILYVGGDFIASRDANVKSDIYVEKSNIVITGDFVQDAMYVNGEEAKVFSLPTTYTGNESKVVFKGTGAQSIKTRWGYNSLRKGSNYINFPDIEVQNSNGVTITPDVAAAAQNIHLTTGKLILDSRRLTAGTDTIYGGNGTPVLATASDASSNTLLAHLMLAPGANKVTYNRSAASLGEVGVIQVKLALDQAVAGSTVPTGKSIVGMGSPFEQISADYFMWNHLMFPYNNNIIGANNFTETNPRVTIPAGKGFVVGLDLKGDAYSNYKLGSDWTSSLDATAFAQRAKDGYVFDRFALDNKNNLYPLALHGNKNSAFGTVGVTDNAYAKENIVNNNVQVTLIDGYNYLANPYTTPLDVSGLVDGSTTPNEWGVTNGSTGSDIYNYVWVLNPTSKASATHNLSSGAAYAASEEKIYASYTYLLISQLGATAGDDYTSDGSSNNTTIAPLQMFLVYANNGRSRSTLTIPESKRQITSGSVFLRSTPIVKTDDFLFQVTDQKTQVYDRTSVVIRTPEQISSNSIHTNKKKLMTTISANQDNTSSAEYKSVTEAGVVGKTLHSALFTKDNLGNALESNFLPTLSGITEKTTDLYLSPSQTTQDITIKALRLNTMDRVSKIILQDKKLNKEFELSSGKDYLTTVSPSDAQNRFSLRFILGTSSVEDDIETAKSIHSYYRDNTLTVAGFEDADMGSLISIYDVQGRLLKQAKVNELTMNLTASFTSGAYIVKVVGNKSYVSKFLVR